MPSHDRPSFSWPDSGTRPEELLAVATDAARQAGAVLKDWAQRFTVSEKSPANLVTEAYLAAQDAIHSMIYGRFRDHNFLGEEGLVETNSDSPWRWVIDPLDGTSNYVHGFPYYAVNIAAQFGAELMVAVTFDPNRDELFTAIRGCGAVVNERAIRPTRVTALRDAMVVASLPVACRPEHRAVQQFLNVMPHVQTVQRTGSAALNLAYVAAGRIDAFWSSSLKPWDMAAGILLVQEAGGRATKMNGQPIELEIPDLLSSNGSAIHEALQQLL
ncbi:MAG TPA: inositol monophosphatase family protein [Planctomycetaceae bacterium]|nr:inositol monophosphatase family protein [Planctomycetaceae bacterium]